VTVFHGRDEELSRLINAQKLPGSKLFVLMGRRRIGKSTLIDKFAENQVFYRFMGLAPGKKTMAQDQRDEFSRLLSEQCDLPEFHVDDWAKLFSLLGREVSQGKVIIMLDEISWMADKDDTFLSKLKSAWDLYFSKNPELTLVLCGSVSAWIDEHIVGSTAFMGRPSLELRLDELPLETCAEFWGPHQERIAAYEKLKVLGVTGGVPRYLELIDPSKTAEENIRNMCFVKDAILALEFNRIFSDVFGRRSAIYLTIIRALLNQSLTMEEIIAETLRSKGGDMSIYLKDLVLAGFLRRDYTWNLKTGVVSKNSRYRLSDNYLRFYLKYIEPNMAKIDKNIFEVTSISSLPGWDSMMGFQFENIIYKNEKLIFKELGVHLSEVVFANPYYQTKTKERDGCQIDYLLQTKYNNVYIIEIKFSKHKIGVPVIDEVREKIKRLKLPKNYSYRPVLIHVNGVTEELVDAQYFSNIINFSKFLEMKG
jgi:AAA+ ATPase superfamily predicted ATPase